MRLDSKSPPTEAYLYSIRNGKLEKRYGTLGIKGSGHAFFWYFDGETCTNKRIVVSRLEHDIFNGMLWSMQEIDDNAKALFIMRQTEIINECQAKIRQCEDNLTLIYTTKEWQKI